MPNLLKKLIRFFIVTLLLITGSLVIGSELDSENYQVSAQSAESELLSVGITAELNLYESGEDLSLSIDFQNNSPEKVVTEYRLADVWNTRNQNLTGEDSPSISRSGNNLIFNFSEKPIKPGQSREIQLSAQTSIFRKVAESRLLEHGKLRTGFFNQQRLNVNSYQINYPGKWGNPDVVNLVEEGYQFLEDGNQLQTLDLKGAIPNILVAWENSYEFKADLEVEGVDSGKLFPLLRRNTNQLLAIDSFNNLSSIYWDESGNIFAESNNTNSPNIPITVSYEPEAKLEQVDESNFGKVSFPYEFRQRILGLDVEKLSESEIVDSVISETLSYFDVSFDESRFEISDRGLDGKELNQLEYLLVITTALSELDIRNEIVWMDRLDFGGGRLFLIEICSESSKCKYYNLNPNSASENSREDTGLGIQLASFSGINQLIFSSIRNSNNYNLSITDVVDKDEEDNLESVQGRNITSVVSTPERVRNFVNFPVELTVKNTGDQAIFLDSLEIAGREYPVIEQQLGGLHQGVLPGQSRDFSIDNIFLPHVFFGAEIDTEIQLKVNYITATENYSETVTKQIQVQQNYWFWGLFGVGIFSIFVALFAFYELYLHNKLKFISAKWRVRRKIDDWLWQFKKKLTSP